MIKLALGFALLVAAAAPVAAQVKPDAEPARFDVADANHDGKVDRAEYGNYVEEVVLLHDADRDGKLSRSECARDQGAAIPARVRNGRIQPDSDSRRLRSPRACVDP